MNVRRDSTVELTRSLRDGYWRADRHEKTAMLNTFCEATGYHRKYASRLLRWGAADRGTGRRKRGRPQTYDALVVGALQTVAEATSWICGKRLAPVLPETVAALEREGALRLSPQVREALVAMSAATIDRRLAPYKRRHAKGLGVTCPGSLLKRQIPIRTFTAWDDQVPGFTEVDLVAHCGESAAGVYICSLSLTDIATGWTECTSVLNKGQEAVFEGLKRLRTRLPFPLLGIDSDNGTEFINKHLLNYCQSEHITFTRCRPYHKDDQAHIEQKNGNVVRRWIGYERLEGQALCGQLDTIYTLLRVYLNGFLPVRKCISKERVGSKLTKRYDRAATPLARAVQAGVIPPGVEAQFRHLLDEAGPMARKRQVDRELDRVWDLQDAWLASVARHRVPRTLLQSRQPLLHEASAPL